MPLFDSFCCVSDAGTTAYPRDQDMAEKDREIAELMARIAILEDAAAASAPRPNRTDPEGCDEIAELSALERELAREEELAALDDELAQEEELAALDEELAREEIAALEEELAIVTAELGAQDAASEARIVERGAQPNAGWLAGLKCKRDERTAAAWGPSEESDEVLTADGLIEEVHIFSSCHRRHPHPSFIVILIIISTAMA